MTGSTAAQVASRVHEYCAYGVSIRSDVPLPLPQEPQPALFELEIRSSKEPIARSVRRTIELEGNLRSVFDVGSLSDGSHYVGLAGIGEILIARDGRSIVCYRFQQSNSESFNAYLLAQALSFSLVKNGFEPLHATVVVVAGKAAVFLGNCGFGKSTLAAAFVQAGHRLLTDDLLVLCVCHDELVAYPGSPRIKLFPELARRFFMGNCTAVPMNPRAQKVILALENDSACTVPVPITAIYALAPRPIGESIEIAPLTPKDAFMAMLGSSFNRVVRDPARPRRQFEWTETVTRTLLVKSLSYPRTFQHLPLVVDAVLSDLCSTYSGSSACGA